MCSFSDQVLVLLRANFPSRAINENDGNGRGGTERYDGDDKDNDDSWILGSGDVFLHKMRFKRDQIGL